MQKFLIPNQLFKDMAKLGKQLGNKVLLGEIGMYNGSLAFNAGAGREMFINIPTKGVKTEGIYDVKKELANSVKLLGSNDVIATVHEDKIDFTLHGENVHLFEAKRDFKASDNELKNKNTIDSKTNENTMQVSYKEFITVLKRVMEYASKDATLDALNGVHFFTNDAGKLFVEALDGHKFCRASIKEDSLFSKIPHNLSFNIPLKLCKALCNAFTANLTFHIQNNVVYITCPEYEIIVKQTYDFPDTKGFIDNTERTNHISVTFDAKYFLKKLQLCCGATSKVDVFWFSQEEHNELYINTCPNTDWQAKNHRKLLFNTEGKFAEGYKVAFPVKDIESILKKCKKITMDMPLERGLEKHETQTKPCAFAVDNLEDYFIIMPMQIYPSKLEEQEEGVG